MRAPRASARKTDVIVSIVSVRSMLARELEDDVTEAMGAENGAGALFRGAGLSKTRGAERAGWWSSFGAGVVDNQLRKYLIE